MSRSQVTCLKCKSPLMARRHSGLFVLKPEVRSIRPVLTGVEVECPHCGTRRLLTPDEDQAA